VVLTCELPVPANMAHVPIEFLFHLIKQEEWGGMTHNYDLLEKIL
jgi:hypothetical protein